MDKRGLIGTIIFMGVLVVVGFFWFVGEKGFVEVEDMNVKDCLGKDCVKVQITCCPCSMGGKEKCVKESEVEKYQEKLNECPKDITCAAVYSCIIESCNGTRKIR